MKLTMTYNMGDFVSLIIHPERKMQIVGIEVYADGGFQYRCNWVDSEGMLRFTMHFEMELEPYE